MVMAKLDLLLAGSGTFLGLYRNDGKRFRDITTDAGLANVPSGYSLNFVDYDSDGRIDAVVTRLNATAVLLRGMLGENNHWIGFNLRGRTSKRDGIGARVRIVTTAGERWNHATTSVGYASSSDRRVHFGLGKESAVKEIEVTWPSGIVQRLKDVKGDGYVDIEEPER
jgi:hypothetical protein